MMRPSIKALNQAHKIALETHAKLAGELDNLLARSNELDAMETALTPVQPAIGGGDIEALVAYRMAEQQRAMRLDAIATVKADLAYQVDVLKAQTLDARLTCNRIAGNAWNALTEALLDENKTVLTLIFQAVQKSEVNLQRWLSELPDMTPVELEALEQREGFPKWI